MRSSKSRSRSKSNRQRSLGNIVNRVFDSSGPEGKVRGTPQQIIDKYLTLARDAQLSNDRVAEQNFLQHAEHYTRMLGEAQREMNREQEQRQAQHEGGQQNGQVHQNGGQNGGGQHGGNGNNGGGQGGERPHQRPRYDDRGEREQPDAARGAVAPMREDDNDDGPGLVETPEARQRPAPMATMMPELPQPETPAEAGAAKRPGRAPRKPREKRAPKDESDTTSDEPATKAAE